MEICVLLGNQFHKVKSHYLSPVGRGLEDFFWGGGGEYGSQRQRGGTSRV